MNPTLRGGSSMFEVVRAIHEAIRTESTLIFVLTIAGFFAVLGGGAAWIVDKGYKNTLKERQQIEQRKPEQSRKVGISLGDNVKGNTFGQVEIYGADIAIELKGSAQDNKFGTVVTSPSPSGVDPISQWRLKVARDAGNPAMVQEDLNWLRQQLTPRWNALSSGDRKRKRADFDEVEKKLMEVASDKGKLMSRLSQVTSTK